MGLFTLGAPRRRGRGVVVASAPSTCCPYSRASWKYEFWEVPRFSSGSYPILIPHLYFDVSFITWESSTG
jgi:hypothetical protein